MHTSTDDWRYKRPPSGDRRPGGFFLALHDRVNPTGALEMHQKNETFKSIEDMREAGASTRSV
jgi:hypothetical protein